MKLSFAIVISAWLTFAAVNEKLDLGFRMSDFPMVFAFTMTSLMAFVIDINDEK